MSEYEIDKEVPVPPVIRIRKYPFHEMEAGDSFLVECDPGEWRRVAHTTSSAASAFCRTRRPNWCHKTRKVEGGIRVWLLEREADDGEG